MAGNFTEIDEEFVCENCGKKVPKLGYSCRNHCPYCLHSKHVDIIPGDRAEECHGDLEPVGAEIDSKKGFKHITYSKICNFLKDRIDDLGDSDFKAFYYAMRRQSFKHESLCLYDDMKNIFYRRIEEYAKEHLADQ